MGDPEDLVKGGHKNHGETDEDRPGRHRRDGHKGHLDQRGDLAGFGGDRFAADRRELLPLQQVIVDEKDQDAGGDQDDGEDAPHVEIGLPGDHRVGIRRQEGGPAAQDRGVPELGNGHDEDQERRLEESRRQKRNGDRPEDGRLRGPHVIGALLKVGVQRHQRALDHHVGERDEGERLRNHDAAEAVKLPVEVQRPGYEAIAAEEDDQRKGEEVRRCDQWNERNDFQRFPEDPGSPRGHVGKAEADHEADRGIDRPEQERVDQRLVIIILAEKVVIVLQCESMGSLDALDQDRGNRVEEKEGEQQKQSRSQDVYHVCIQEILCLAAAAGLQFDGKFRCRHLSPPGSRMVGSLI